MELTKIKDNFNFIIFGASGDLAQLKIFPAIYEMVLQNRFEGSYSIYGYARSEMSNEEFRKKFKESLEQHVDRNIYDEKRADELIENVYYYSGQYDGDYSEFADQLLEVQGGETVKNLAFLSVPPVAFADITNSLGAVREKLGGHVQLMIEKPFGSDRASAGELFKMIGQNFDKEDLFLIDHYLGKAPVQSILPLRYNNTILNILLKGQNIENIQISALETLGVDERVGFYDQVGVIKDMVQSHLLQVLTLLTMAMPVNRDVKNIRREKGNILSALRYDRDRCGVSLGQYEGYKDLEGVEKDTNTPTFVALRAFIDLTNWYKVPIYIRTGKKLQHKHTYVVIEFEKPEFSEENDDIEGNRLIIELYPHEDIQIKLVNDEGKVADSDQDVLSQESLACHGDECLPAYGRLILDALRENFTSFLSIDEILASWHFVDDLMECVSENNIKVETYKAGGDGPEAHKKLPEEDGFKWYDPDKL